MRKRSPLPLLSLLLLLALLSGCTVSEQPAEAQPKQAMSSTADMYRRHMEENAVSLSLDDMAALDNVDFDAYKVVFLGESHGVAKGSLDHRLKTTASALYWEERSRLSDMGWSK